MAFRADIAIDWSQSPRLITVAAPSTTVTIQDLYDTLRELEAQVHNLRFPRVVDTERTGGLQELADSRFVGITLTMANAVLAFEDRPGPTLVPCTVLGGNLIAVDALGAQIQPTALTTFTHVTVFQSTAPTLVVTGSQFGAGDIEQIRYRLGIDGMTTVPANTPATSIAAGVIAIRDLIEADVDITDTTLTITHRITGVPLLVKDITGGAVIPAVMEDP